MEHLTPLDALFLDAEDVDRHASLAIASVAVVEGPPPSHAEFVAAVRGRLPRVPRYRQKVRRLPLDLGNPVWVDDRRFDLAYHVRRTALPAPGDEAALCRLIARIMSQRLDRDRPLWECWVIEGLADGRWAVLSKVHHCMADGISGNELYRIVFDESPEPGCPVADIWHPEPEPSTIQLTLGALARNPVDQLSLLWQGVRSPSLLAKRFTVTVRGLAELAGVLVPVAKSSLVGSIGQQRRYGLARASLASVVEVAKANRVTVNDVLLAAVTGAFRSLLLRRGEPPTADAVRTLVPVSVRAAGDEGIVDNRISLMLPLLPVEIDDAVDRLREVHTRLAALKASNEAEAGEAMTTLARHEPFAPISAAIRMVARLPHRNLVTVTTNVPGPRRPLYALGRRIIEMFPYVPIAVRLRTGISALTYDGQMCFGVTSDYDTGPEADRLARDIADGIAELLDRTRPTPARTRRTPARPAATSRRRGRTSLAQGASGPA